MLNVLLAAHRPDSEKVTPYECGFSPIYGQTRTPFSIQYYLVGILFLVFDLEILLLYPIGVTLYNVSVYGFWIAVVFFSVLTLGFVYELGKGVLYFTDQRSQINSQKSLIFVIVRLTVRLTITVILKSYEPIILLKELIEVNIGYVDTYYTEITLMSSGLGLSVIARRPRRHHSEDYTEVPTDIHKIYESQVGLSSEQVDSRTTVHINKALVPSAHGSPGSGGSFSDWSIHHLFRSFENAYSISHEGIFCFKTFLNLDTHLTWTNGKSLTYLSKYLDWIVNTLCEAGNPTMFPLTINAFFEGKVCTTVSLWVRLDDFSPNI